MNATTLLANFATVVEGPGGIERLREIVLGLAFRGRLLGEREVLETSTDAAESQNTTALRSHQIPDHWRWAQYRDIADSRLGKMLDKAKNTGPLRPYLRNANVQWFRFELDDLHSLRLDDQDLEAHTIRAGDLVICEGGEPGRVAICDQTTDGLVIQKALHRSRPRSGMNSKYLAYLLRYYAMSGQLEAYFTGATIKHLTGRSLASLPVPVAPHPEQNAVVSRIEELLERCDELQARQVQQERCRLRFRDSSLDSLVEARSPNETRRTWDRVVSHWPDIAGHVDSFGSLRSTVLQLAVQGRLVPPRNDDGSASDSVEVANSHRASLAAQGLVPKVKPIEPVRPAEAPFCIPEHWRWVRLEQMVSHVVDCLHRTPPYTESGYPAIRTCDVEPGRLLLKQALCVDRATYAEQTRRLVPQAGDVLYSREGGRYGIAAVVPPGVELCLSQRMMQFRCTDGIVPEYLSWFLNSPLGFGQATADVGGSASPHVNIKAIRRFLVPLPPFGEQLRIAACIETLLGSVDDLEQRVERRDDIGSAFSKAIAHRLVNA